ncbi:MAG TPA: hypothetical protein VNI60_01650 [Pyrinomonadaceae bacterium]|nr:hypothetical protein [Pyrinomonadaceae bacterium]
MRKYFLTAPAIFGALNVPGQGRIDLVKLVETKKSLARATDSPVNSTC